MALLDNTHYVDSVGYTAVTAWATGTVIAAGAMRRQLAAPAANAERVFIAIVGGTTHATTEPTWTTTRGALTTDNTVTWQECTGLSGVNGDITNTPSWDQYKAVTSAGTLGQLIKNNAATHLFIMSVAGTIGASQPTFDTTTGNTTTDNAATWRCIGAVGDFTGNQAPHARMANALTANWNAAGNTIYVKSSHAATQSAAITLAGAGTVGSPQRWLCHNGAAYPPAAANLTTGASETSTAGNLSISSVGVYAEGITYSTTGNGTVVNVGVTNAKQKHKNCVFARAGTTGTIVFGNASNNLPVVELEDCDLSFGNVGNTASVSQCTLIWRGGSIIGAAAPTNLINLGTNPSHFTALIDGVDLSALGSGKTIAAALSTQSGLLRFTNCKLGASVTPAGTPGTPHYRVEFINCNSGAINYSTQVYDYAGTLTTEITIVRTGGASDGTTPIAWKVDTTANAKFDQPFECPVIRKWNETTGSPVTLTIEGIWGGGAVPNDDEIWVEVEYLGASGNPGASFVSDAKATVLTAAAAQTASSETWGGSTTDFKLAVTFTPEMEGFIYAYVKCAKVSSTFYIDPKATLS